MDVSSIIVRGMSKTDVRSIIAQWPTRQALATEMGEPVDRVHKWAQNNAVPAWHQSRFLRACVAKGINITASDILSMHEAPAKRQGAA